MYLMLFFVLAILIDVFVWWWSGWFVLKIFLGGSLLSLFILLFWDEGYRGTK